MSLYINNYKNYFMWERIFWLLTSVLFNSKGSFLIKKRYDFFQISIISENNHGNAKILQDIDLGFNIDFIYGYFA